MTPALRAYLASWLHWAENGAPDGEPYFRRAGLCPQARELRKELEALLLTDFGVNHRHPFGGSYEYSCRYTNQTQHLCPARLAWVRAKLEEVE